MASFLSKFLFNWIDYFNSGAMSQNINSMLGGMPDDIEKGGMKISFLQISLFTIIINFGFDNEKNNDLHKTSKEY